MSSPATRLVAVRLAMPRWSLILALFLLGSIGGYARSLQAATCQSPDESSPSGVAPGEPSIAGDDGAGDAPRDSADPLDLSFDDLKFDIEKGADFQESMLTESIKRLDGKKIRIRGFVRPGYKQSGIKNFVLVRDNQQCCFGPGAALYDCVMVKMAEDQAIDFTVRPIGVVGTMQLKQFMGKDGKVWAIFRLNESHQE